MSITAGQTGLASDFVGTSSGSADSGKVPKLGSDGRLALGFTPPRVLSMRHLSGTNTLYGIFSDVGDLVNVISGTDIYLETATLPIQTRNITTDWASAAVIYSAAIIGTYLYIHVRDGSNNWRIYRFDKTNLSAGGTLMTISGQAFSTTGGSEMIMFSDGTNLYFNSKAGNSTSVHIISKYTISGTTLTYASDITCGSTTTNLYYPFADSSGNIYGFSNADSKIRKYNSSGTLQLTTANYSALGASYVIAGKFLYLRVVTTLDYILVTLL